MKIKLLDRSRRDLAKDREIESRSPVEHVYWKECEPFAINDRGYLVHRIVRVMSVCWPMREHHVVEYACGAFANDIGNIWYTDDVEADRVLCVKCEAAAIALGHPTADELCGHHVHVGCMRPHVLCGCKVKGVNDAS